MPPEQRVTMIKLLKLPLIIGKEQQDTNYQKNQMILLFHKLKLCKHKLLHIFCGNLKT